MPRTIRSTEEVPGGRGGRNIDREKRFGCLEARGRANRLADGRPAIPRQRQSLLHRQLRCSLRIPSSTTGPRRPSGVEAALRSACCRGPVPIGVRPKGSSIAGAVSARSPAAHAAAGLQENVFTVVMCYRVVWAVGHLFGSAAPASHRCDSCRVVMAVGFPLCNPRQATFSAS